MNDISQTKEGFIKSMILFIVLLGICFAPFFAFSNTNSPQIQAQVEVTNAHVECRFSTAFNCTYYAIEARTDNAGEYKAIFSCNDAKCVDAQGTVHFGFELSEYPYNEYRIKAVDVNGNIYYHYGNFKPVSNSIELLNNAVVDHLFLKVNGALDFSQYAYSLCNFNGETLVDAAQLNGNKIDLNGLSQGFYIISFKASNGEEIHYKFLKQ